MTIASDLFAELKCPGELELYMGRGESVDVDIEGGRITSAGRTTKTSGAVRVLHEGKLGFAYFTQPEDAQLAVDQAVATMRSVEGDFQFAQNDALHAVPSTFDSGLAQLDIGRHVDAAQTLLQAASEAAPGASITGGGVGCSVGYAELLNSNGVHRSDQSTHYSMGAALVLPDGDGNVSSWYSDESHLDCLDATAIGEEAARRTMALAGPAALPSGGQYCVVFKPEAFIELLGGVVGQALDGDEAHRGKSMWRDHLGKSVANPGLQLRDDPFYAGGIGITNWDGEGRATRVTPLIQDGVLQQFIFNGRDAAKHAQAPTGHAQRDGISPPGTGFHHLVLEHENCMPQDELEGQLVIESLLGAHTANAATGDFSVTSPNVWRQMDGQLQPLKEVALAGNLGQWLQKLDGVSQEVRAMSGARIPSVRIQNVAVSV